MTTAPTPAGWERACDAELAGLNATAVAVAPRRGTLSWSAGGPVGEVPEMTPGTTAYAGSVTKQVIAALVARAVLDRLVQPDTRVRSVLPELPAWTDPIRIRHLLHHCAGLPQPPALTAAVGRPDDPTGWSSLDNATVLAALHRVEPPSAPPGRVHAYDNTGYVLLAEVVRAARAEPVEALARRQLFQPVRMTGSWLGGPAPVTRPGFAAPPRTVGDGGLWTCATDVVRWLTALNTGALGDDLTELVQRPGRLDDGTRLDYAWGMAPRPANPGPLYLHAGSWPGWSAMTVRNPSTGTAVAILAAVGADEGHRVPAAAQNLHRLLQRQD